MCIRTENTYILYARSIISRETFQQKFDKITIFSYTAQCSPNGKYSNYQIIKNKIILYLLHIVDTLDLNI